MDDSTERAANGNNTGGLTRDIRIIELLAGNRSAERGGLSVTELASLTGRSKSVVSRVLTTLLDAGLVRRDPTTRAFTVGARLFAIAARSADAQLVQVGRPILRGLVRATMETAHLSILHRGNVLTLASEVSPLEVRSAGWEGVTTAAWRTPSGRVLVSDWDDESLFAWYDAHGHDSAVVDADNFGRERNPFPLYDSPPVTPQTIRDRQTLLAEITRIRRQGYALVDGELEDGVLGASAPVRDHTGRVQAALNVSGPRDRLAPRIAQLGALLQESAAVLSRALGASRPH